MNALKMSIPTGLRILAISVTGLIFWCGSLLVPKSLATLEPPLSPMPTKCLGPYNGKSLSQEELNLVVEKHKRYLATIPAPKLDLSVDPYAPISTSEREPLAAETGLADPFPASVKGTPKAMSNEGRADLCGARLIGLDLKEKDLRYARFMGARLEKVDLSGAVLDGSDMTWVGFDDVTAEAAKFRWVTMPHALIIASRLSKTTFYRSNFHHAELAGSDFTDGAFENADLNAARLRGTILANVDFGNADLSNVSYEAKLGYPPRLGAFRNVKGLNSLLSHTESAASLRELQQQLESSGMRVEAAQVRSAIVDAKGISNYSFQPALLKIIYGIPYAYGERPERLLLIVALLVPTFAGFYFLAIRRQGRGAIWLIREAPHEDPERKMKGILLNKQNCGALRIALLFSIRSAFRIGWKDFNVGDWITRMQQNGYRLEGQGWVRSIAGFQSLISVYLVALLILSYIGA